MRDATDPDSGVDAVRAFEDLRAEVSVLRQAVEALPGTWEDSRPADYSPDLGRIVQELGAVEKRLGQIESLPTLLTRPGELAGAAANGGVSAVREAVRRLDDAVRSTSRIGEDLIAAIGAMRTRQEQRASIIHAVVFGIFAGMALLYLLPSVLPWGAGDWLAASMIGGGPWRAGEALMRDAHPASFTKMAGIYNACGNMTEAKCVAVIKNAADQATKKALPTVPESAGQLE